MGGGEMPARGCAAAAVVPWLGHPVVPFAVAGACSGLEMLLRSVAARAGAGARLPDCHSKIICSRRSNRRIRQAVIRTCREAGSQAHFSSHCAASRRRAILSPKERDWFSMRRILTNKYSVCKGKFGSGRNFFDKISSLRKSSFCGQKEAKKLYPFSKANNIDPSLN